MGNGRGGLVRVVCVAVGTAVALALASCADSDDDTTVDTEPAVSEPAVTEPAVTEPVDTEPAVTEPAVTEPAVSEPVVTESADTDPVDTDPVASDPAATEPAETEPVDEASVWQVHEGGDDCVCADGSEFQFFSRPADPERVVLYFQGGGACFTAEMCDFDDGTYKVTTDERDIPDEGRGLFDFDNPLNPVADWSVVFVPYCTGDVHIGDATHEYAPDLVVEHNGIVNARRGLDHLVAEYPDAAEILVTGSSAGGVPAPLFGGLAADEYPDARVTVLADASGGYASNPGVNGFIGELWGTAAANPGWPNTVDLTTADIGIPDLFHLAGNHDPDVRFARFDNAFDEVQAAFAAAAGASDEGLLAVLDQNEQLVEGNGVDLDVYIAPGDDHTVLLRPEMYELEVEGVAFVDWFATLIDGGDPGDVRCVECGGPAGG